MVGPIESVTVAVSELERCRRLFEEQLGLTTVSDGRASVGLLSAWRYPVHESVRLIEMAHGGQVHGRVRLALYEDAPHPRSTADGPQHAPRLPGGPRALDFRASAPVGAATLIEAASGLPLIIAEPSQRGRGPVGSVWVLSADSALARRFYAEALGYRISAETELTVGDGGACFESLGFGRGTRLRLTRLGAGNTGRGGVLLLGLTDQVPDPEVPARPSRLGTLGINLMTCRCEDLDELIERLKPLGIEPVAAPSHVGLPDGRLARVMVAFGPSGEAFEFVEIDD
jgi:catechol 2,3-dioxygenase-like lactoylglutathione lyase family enzyme